MNLTEVDEKPRSRHAHRLSPDGKWRSFPKVPHLLQYVSSGIYYARIKVNGKLIRQSLNTDVFTTAKIKLPDFLKEQRANRQRIAVPTYAEAKEAYLKKVETNTEIKPKTKEYWKLCLAKIGSSWPEIAELPISEISDEACREWAAHLKGKIHEQYFNNTIGTLKNVVDEGLRIYSERGGTGISNSAAEVNRTRVPPKELRLPEPSIFRDLVANVRKGSGQWGEAAGDLIEFLAFTGMRIKSEAKWVQWEDVDWKRKEIIVRGDPETLTKNGEIRRIPIIADLEKLLLKMKGVQNCSGAVLKLNECQGALTRACSELGIPRITHHDLRHLFATRCIESGVDIPTVARWLGHKDGGALAMKTYGHLRNEHSQAMAAKVRF